MTFLAMIPVVMLNQWSYIKTVFVAFWSLAERLLDRAIGITRYCIVGLCEANSGCIHKQTGIYLDEMTGWPFNEFPSG